MISHFFKIPFISLGGPKKVNMVVGVDIVRFPSFLFPFSFLLLYLPDFSYPFPSWLNGYQLVVLYY